MTDTPTSHSSMLFREAEGRIKAMGLAGQIAPSEVVIFMQQKALSMDEALRLLMAQRGLSPATVG